jgi:hypothetical protein
MAEIIYTEFKTSDINKISSDLVSSDINKVSSDLVSSIKKNGIQYPLVIQCNNKTLKENFEVGNQRNLIALSLGLEKIPVIFYSVHHKTGFTGQNITDVNDLIEIFGENVKKEPVYEWVANVIKNVRLKNNYPPDPLKL